MAFGWFRKRVTRYGTTIALIAALCSACQKDLPKEEATKLSALSSQVEKSLRESKPDKQKIKEFARTVASVRKHYDINIEIPENLERGIRGLELYYDNIRVFLNDLDKFRGTFGIVPFTYHPKIHIITIIIEAERDLGVRLEEERKEMRDSFNELLEFAGKTIRNTQDDYYKRLFEKMKLDIIKGLQKLN